MIKFKLPELDLSQYKKLYCGKETRLATATSVSFVDYNTILVPSLLGKKIYLIDINNNSFNIIDEIDCGVYIDLIDFKDNTIITANALSPEHIDGSISIFKLENRKIKFIKEIIVKKNLRVHGCRFIDNDNIIVASNDKLNSGIYFINLNTNEHTNYVKFNDRVKDILIKDMVQPMPVQNSMSMPIEIFISCRNLKNLETFVTENTRCTMFEFAGN